MFRRTSVLGASVLLSCALADPGVGRGAPPVKPPPGKPGQAFKPQAKPAAQPRPPMPKPFMQPKPVQSKPVFAKPMPKPFMQSKPVQSKPVFAKPMPKPQMPNKPPQSGSKSWHDGHGKHHGKWHDGHDKHHKHHGRHHHDWWRNGRFQHWGQWHVWRNFGVAGVAGFVNPLAVGGVAAAAPGVVGGAPAGGGAPSFDGSAGSIPNPPITADIMRAFADGIRANEEARILRETYEGVRLENVKKRAETAAYLESLTPTWTARQAKITRDILTRAQSTSDLSAIGSGQALNVLLDDLRTAMARRALAGTALTEETLRHINVTASGGHGNLGLLRNGGHFTWPNALTHEAVLSKEEREDIERAAQTAVQQAGHGAAPRDVLAGLRRFVDTTEIKLVQRIGELPVDDYLEAKRFLFSLDAARVALEKGEAVACLKFQRWTSKGRTTQEVVDYMLREGLQFASAVPGDEQAYRAVHSALAAYDVEVHQLSAAVASAKQRE